MNLLNSTPTKKYVFFLLFIACSIYQFLTFGHAGVYASFYELFFKICSQSLVEKESELLLYSSLLLIELFAYYKWCTSKSKTMSSIFLIIKFMLVLPILKFGKY